MIPDKFLCGQNIRDNKLIELAFLTYKKLDGTIASEKSFNNWLRVDRLWPGQEVVKTWFDNVPTSGIKVVRTIGGNSGNIRQAYVRIKDPRGFEVEITDENFLDICKESGVIKGVLDGEFVYEFGDASRIYLTRFGSNHYTNAMNQTKKMIEEYKIKESQPKFSFRDIKLGHKYNVNYNGTYGLTAVYIGKVKCYDSWKLSTNNEHVFLILNYSWLSNSKNSFAILRNANIVSDMGECWSENECHKLTDNINVVDKGYELTGSITENRGKGTQRSKEVIKWIVDNYVNKNIDI